MKKFLTAALIFGMTAAQAPRAESPAVGAKAPLPRTICAAGEAYLTHVTGGVLLSRGGSFTELGAGVRLYPGDRILVREGAADIRLGDSSAFQARTGAMVTIAEKDGATCAKRVSPDRDVVAQATEFDPTPYVVGGALAVVAGVGAGVGASNTGNNNDEQQKNAALALLLALSN